jgi:hypothetical protein
MSIDPVTLAQDVVVLVAPFLPYLTSLGQSVQKKLQDVIVANGGEVVWQAAQTVWGKVKGLFQGNRAAEAKVTLAVEEPEKADHIRALVEVLAERLKSDPALAQELQRELASQGEAVQMMIGGQRARFIAAEQEILGRGTQIMRGGDDSLFWGAKQKQGEKK